VRLTASIEVERARHLQEAELLRVELMEQKTAGLGMTAERDQVRGDLAAITAKPDASEPARQEQRKAAELDAKRFEEMLVARVDIGLGKAHHEAGKVREDAANLRGQVEAMKTQVAELMQVLAAKRP